MDHPYKSHSHALFFPSSSSSTTTTVFFLNSTMLNTANNLFSANPGPLMMDKRWKANIETAPNCPRCASTNTKFCYYNNYSLSQPRYFCKGCRRYWTKGGSLRNVPLGGGCRKTRRSKSVRAPSTDSSYDVNPSSSDGSSDDQLSGRKSGSDIDLAVVFSKYMSNNQASSNSFSSSSYSYSNSNSPGSDSGLVVPGNPSQFYDTARQENPILGMDVVNGGFGVGQSFGSGLETGLDGLQALLNDAEIDQEMPNFLSETAELPNFSWQQQQQLQGFDGVVMEDEHSIFQNNILNGNWNSFDILPSYGG